MTPTWWNAFHAGDLRAFAQLIETYQQDVRAIAYAVLLDDGLAEDVAQETFIVAWTRRAQLRDPNLISGWLVTIARNRGRDLLRARRREVLVDDPEIAADASSPQLRLEREALRASCRTVLARVPERYREVLVLYYSQERPVCAIAKTLGISEAAAMQRLSRGRRFVERHGSELAQFAGVRRRDSLAIAVLALLTVRRTAAAAPRRSASWLVALGCVLATFSSDGAANARAPSIVDHEPTMFSDNSAGASRSHPLPALGEGAPLIDAASRPQLVRPAPRAVVSREQAPTDDVPEPQEAPRVRPASPPRVALATVDPFEEEDSASAPSVAVAPPPMSRPQLPLDPINGLIETAGMPRRGDISFDTVGLAMMLRIGVTKHVAVHVGEVPMDTDKGTVGANVATALGGGVKIGGRLADNLHLAVLAEAANEVNLKSLKGRDGWMARSYASLTWRNGRHHTTAFGGVVAEFDGTNRWRAPIGGFSTQLGWDDRLAFLFESQYIGNAVKTKRTHLVGLRFRANEPRRSILGIDRARIDVGMIYLDRVDDEDDVLLPWLQAGLGW